MKHYNKAIRGIEPLDNYRKAFECFEKVSSNLLHDDADRNLHSIALQDIRGKLKVLERPAA